MTELKDKTFLDWLFGSNATSGAPLTVQVGGRQLRLEELQDEIERERASSLAELEAVRLSKTEAEAARATAEAARVTAEAARVTAEAARVTAEAALEHANGELLGMKAALESAQAEVERHSQLNEEARAASVRDAEARRKLSLRCAALQVEGDKLRAVLQAGSKRETDLEQRVRELEQAAERASTERAELESVARTQLSARQEELEQRQKELSLARADAERFHKELKRQQSTFLQASGQQLASLESERRAWAAWLGQIWNTLLYTLGPAAPLALETYLGDLEPVGRATTTEAAEARLREFMAARALCRHVAIVEQQSELRLELEPGPALEGTSVGWIGILATRQLATMLQRPLCTRELEQSGARLTVHTTSRVVAAESTPASV